MTPKKKNKSLVKRVRNGSFAKEYQQNPDLRAYIATAQQYELLTQEREHELAVRARAGDKKARAELIERNLRLVVSVAHGYAGRGMTAHDLISEGNIGLISAVDSFDPERGTRFSTHAIWRISEAISTSLAEKSLLVSIPRYLYRARNNVVHAENRFYEEHGRKPAEHEVAEAASVTPERLKLVRESQRSLSSLDSAPSQSEQGGDDVLTLAERVADVHADTEGDAMSALEAEELHALMQRVLTPREQVVLALLYGLDQLHGKTFTPMEIAVKLNILPLEVEMCRVRALDTLREAYGASERDEENEYAA